MRKRGFVLLVMMLLFSMFVSRYVVQLAGSETDLVGCWKFDMASGSYTFDSSGNGNNGTLVNMEACDWVTGIHGFGLQFDGTDEYLEVSDSASLDGLAELTVALWIYPKAYGGPYSTMLGKWYEAATNTRCYLF